MATFKVQRRPDGRVLVICAGCGGISPSLSDAQVPAHKARHRCGIESAQDRPEWREGDAWTAASKDRGRPGPQALRNAAQAPEVGAGPERASVALRRDGGEQS